MTTNAFVLKKKNKKIQCWQSSKASLKADSFPTKSEFFGIFKPRIPTTPQNLEEQRIVCFHHIYKPLPLLALIKMSCNNFDPKVLGSDRDTRFHLIIVKCLATNCINFDFQSRKLCSRVDSKY